MDKFNQNNIILFSASPRRAQLLKAMGLDITVMKGGGDESYPAELSPVEIAEFIAKKKSQNYQTPLKFEDILITADTIVVVDGKISGKPNGREEAICMLKNIADKEHRVITGYTIRTDKEFVVSHSETKVWFKKLTEEEIEYYVDNFKPYDKAGGYGIQEWIGYIGIESIEGSYYNVMGLPTDAIYNELSKIINK